MNNVNKIKSFSIATAFSSVGLVVVAVLFSFLYSNAAAKGDLELANSLNIVSWVTSILFTIILLISYISLIIQASRIDDYKNWITFLILSFLSLLPIVAIAIACRCAHLIYMERQRKIAIVDEKLKEMDQITFNDMNQYNIENKYENEYFQVEENNVTIENNLTNNNAINDEYINNEPKEISKQKISSPQKNNELKPFDRNKYLSLKGTNYSKVKKDGKRKIPNSKWNALVLAVDKLEMKIITEEEFFKEKDRILSSSK